MACNIGLLYYKNLVLGLNKYIGDLKEGTNAYKYKLLSHRAKVSWLEGNISYNDSSFFEMAFNYISNYYDYFDKENILRDKARDIAVKLIKLRVDKIYNGILLKNRTEMKNAMNQLVMENNTVKQEIKKMIDEREKCVYDLFLLIKDSPYYSKIYSSDSPNKALEELGSILEKNFNESEENKDYSKNIEELNQIEESIQEIKQEINLLLSKQREQQFSYDVVTDSQIRKLEMEYNSLKKQETLLKLSIPIQYIPKSTVEFVSKMLEKLEIIRNLEHKKEDIEISKGYIISKLESLKKTGITTYDLTILSIEIEKLEHEIINIEFQISHVRNMYLLQELVIDLSTNSISLDEYKRKNSELHSIIMDSLKSFVINDDCRVRKIAKSELDILDERAKKNNMSDTEKQLEKQRLMKLL